MKQIKKFRRSVALLLAVLMLLGVVACAGTEDPADTTADVTGEPADPSDEPWDKPAGDEKNVVLYVSPDGDDETGKPYRTFEGVKNAVRAIDKSNLESVTVYFMEGRYDPSTAFTPEDSGTENCRITYAAYNDAEVIIGGAKVIPASAFHPIEDEEIKAQLSEEVRDKVLCASLTEIGMTLDECRELRESFRRRYGLVSLYLNGQRQTNARYPDGDDFLTPYAITQGEKVSMLRYKKSSDIWKNKIGNWNMDDRDVYVWGCWKYDWADDIFRISEKDADSALLTLDGTHNYGMDKYARYWFYNVFEEITVPGEWSYDLENGLIYYYPTEDFENSVLTVSTYRENIMSMTGVSYIGFDGIILEGSQAMAVNGTMNDVVFNNCIIRDVNSYGMRVIGNNIHLTGCEFTQLGISCLDIDGGDRETLTPSGNLIENCYFHHYGQVRGLGSGDFAAWIRGMGCTFRHNECAYAAFYAVYFYGNEHLIEYNEFHHLGAEVDDGGIVYSGRHYDYCRNVIRYNYFHDIHSSLSNDQTGQYYPKFFYEDDGLCDTSVYGNLFVGTENDTGTNKVQGFDSICDNNVFVKTRNGPISWGAALYQENENEERDKFLMESPFMSDAWKEAYPEMDKYRDGAMTEWPEDPNVSISHNLWFVNEEAYGEDFIYFVAYIEGYSDRIRQDGNQRLSADLLSLCFVDPENGDYTMKEDAPIFAEDPDFEAIPFALMGRNKG